MKDEIYVFLMAMMPVVELKGAIPLGLSLGFSMKKSLLISSLGNILIVPVLLHLFKPIDIYLKKFNILSRIMKYIKRKSLKKTRNLIKKYKYLGLFILVALPLPTTGGWTSSIAANILKLDRTKALIIISLGIMTSGLIVSSLSYLFVDY